MLFRSDDSFANLSPEQQKATMDDIHSQMDMHQDIHNQTQLENQQANDPYAQAQQNLISKQQHAFDVPLAAGSTVAHAAMAHPGLAGAAAAAAFPEVAHKVPGVGQLMDLAKEGIGSMNAGVASKNAAALGQLENQARQYLKQGLQVPEGLQKVIDAQR